DILNTYRDILDELVVELMDRETLHRKDLERVFDRVEKRPRITAFNDFGGRTPSDKPPIKTPGELAKERGEPWPPHSEPQPTPVGVLPGAGDVLGGPPHGAPGEPGANGAGPHNFSQQAGNRPAGEANGEVPGHPKPGSPQVGLPYPRPYPPPSPREPDGRPQGPSSSPSVGPPNYGAPPGWRPATEPPAPAWRPAPPSGHPSQSTQGPSAEPSEARTDDQSDFWFGEDGGRRPRDGDR
ncbi:MAG: cell division protein FtsH, partial [Actinomycetota bacterium]|nr:cell division protein FtsH [Actinomycetota bacterium]